MVDKRLWDLSEYRNNYETDLDWTKAARDKFVTALVLHNCKLYDSLYIGSLQSKGSVHLLIGLSKFRKEEFEKDSGLTLTLQGKLTIN